MSPQFATEKKPEIKFYSLPTEFTITFLVWYDHPQTLKNRIIEKKKKRKGTQMKKLKIKKSGGERESLPEGSVAIELNI